MKKLLVWVMLLSVMLCFAACGEKTKTIYLPLTVITDNGETQSVTEYIYDEKDFLTQIRRETGTVTVENDSYGRPVRLIEENGAVTAYTYTDDGQYQRVEQDGEQYKTCQEYAYEGNVLTRVTTTVDGEVIATNDYAYDEQGRIAQITKTSANGTVNCDKYTYKEGNVTVVAGLDENNEETVTLVITRDEHGNILKQEMHIFGVLSATNIYTYKAIEVPADSPRN